MADDLSIVEVMAQAIFDARWVYHRAIDATAAGPPWEEAAVSQKMLARVVATEAYEQGEISFEDSHNANVQRLIGAGWTLGPKFDRDAKTWPYLIPFAELPVAIQAGLMVYETMLHAIMRFYEVH